MNRFNPTGSQAVTTVWTLFFGACVGIIIAWRFVLGGVPANVSWGVVFGLILLATFGWFSVLILAHEVRRYQEKGDEEIAKFKKQFVHQGVIDDELRRRAELVAHYAEQKPSPDASSTQVRQQSRETQDNLERVLAEFNEAVAYAGKHGYTSKGGYPAYLKKEEQQAA